MEQGDREMTNIIPCRGCRHLENDYCMRVRIDLINYIDGSVVPRPMWAQVARSNIFDCGPDAKLREPLDPEDQP